MFDIFLVIKVNSIWGDRFRTFSEVSDDAFKRYNFFYESVTPFLFLKCTLIHF